MKRVLIVISIMILTTISLYAQDIDTQMQKIREASPQERVQMMNSLKRQIVQMNEAQRNEAIAQLRSGAQHKQTINQDVSREQFQNSQEMFHNQMLQHQQAGKQYMQSRGDTRLKPQR